MITSISNNDPGKDVMYVETNSNLDALIDDTDKKMLSYIARLYQVLNGEKLDFTRIQTAIDALQEFNMRNEYRYLNNLLHPEKCKGVKIPSQIPIPSCSFQLHNCVTLKTNASGNLAIVFNPYFLASNVHPEWSLSSQQKVDDNLYEHYFHTNYFSSLFVNNDITLNGYSENTHWEAINIGQEIPPVYDQYRLVSASLVIKYIGRLDTVSGVIGGAIVFDETPEIGTDYTHRVHNPATSETNEEHQQQIPSNLAKYGNFDLAMDAFYRQENLCLEGIRQLYFPLDNSYEEYTRLMNGSLVNNSLVNNANGNPMDSRMKTLATEDYLKNGFRQVVYVLGAPANQACFKLDIYCNFECLPASPFLNYLPLSMNTEFNNPEMKKKASIVIQQKPIMKASEEVVTSESPSIWTKLKNKFMDSLPGIGKLISTGLVTAIPQLQLGTMLANTMSSIANGVSSIINSNASTQPSNQLAVSNSLGPATLAQSIPQSSSINPDFKLSTVPMSNSTIYLNNQ